MDNRFVKDRVSVITPVYNAEKYLLQMLKSVYQQNYEDIEIILVDDQSTDSSASMIHEEMNTHSEIVYYLQPENMGAGIARNKAMELATGQYVAFLDSDDIWKENKLLMQLELMKTTHAPFSYTAIEMIDDSGNIIKGKREIRQQCDYNLLLHNTMIATSSVIIDRQFFGDFRMSVRRGGQDYATWLNLLRNGVVAVGINEALVSYRVLHNSLSSNKFKSIKQLWEIQKQDEGICTHRVLLNEIRFVINALKKYFI